MNQYYLLELIPENDVIKRKILYKIEFTRPYCVINILSSHVKVIESMYFVLSDNIDYIYEFFNVESNIELFEICKSLYNKGNFFSGYVKYNLNDNIIEFYIDLSSKNFNKYYSYNTLCEIENYNVLMCEIYIYNKEKFSLYFQPLHVLSKRKISKKIVNKLLWKIASDEIILESKEFKKFDTFRDLVLFCIELDKKQFFSEYKDLSKNEKLIYNEYYDILMDVAKCIEI